MNLRSRLEKAEQRAPSPPEPPPVVVRTSRHQPCILHTEPGPEMWKDAAGNQVPVTDEMRAAWERDGVSVFRRTFIGTCHSNGCDPSLPGAERWLR